MELFEKTFNYENYNTAYKYYNEYIRDNVSLAGVVLLSYTKCISENKNVISKDYRESVQLDFYKTLDLIESRAGLSEDNNIFIAARAVQKNYKLSDLEWFWINLCILAKTDKRYDKLFKVIDNKFSGEVNVEIALKLFYFVENISSIVGVNSIINKLKYKMLSLCFKGNTNQLDDLLFTYIMDNNKDNMSIEGLKTFEQHEQGELIAREYVAKKIYNFLNGLERDSTAFMYIYGKEGIGKKTIIKRVSGMFQEKLIIMDVKEFLQVNKENFYEKVLVSLRLALLERSPICINNFDTLTDDIKENMEYINFIFGRIGDFTSKVFLISNSKNKNLELKENRLWFELEIEDLTKSESREIWEYYMNDMQNMTDVKPLEMANRFTFTPMQIKQAVEEAKNFYLWNNKTKLSNLDMSKCAYKQIITNLGESATLIKAKYNWNQLILDKKEKIMLKNACNQMKYKNVVYEKWGMNKRLLYGTGLSMLFEGPPGTGKTMAAQVVANELGLDIYKVDLSRIVSKYIGETEKNLGALFDEAKKSNVILLFDETDAIFGKRTEVKDSHDKNANLETSYLLQKMEEYDGITIMTTNYLQNIDKAFFRRISYVIHFSFPTAVARKKIWQGMYPKEMPLSKSIDFNFIAKNFELSGGNIKNIALTSAFLAASEKSKVEMKHIILAIKYELSKQGKMLLKEDFAEYGYLLDENI